MQVSENPRVSNKVIIFPAFFPLFSFSHKLIEHFMKVVGSSLVNMHANFGFKTSVANICFGSTEVHLFSFRG